METTRSRSEYRSAAQAREEAALHSTSTSRERARRRRRLHRQLSQRPHWSLYVGVALLGLGVVALVVAALLTR